jgi:hypothetical protein
MATCPLCRQGSRRIIAALTDAGMPAQAALSRSMPRCGRRRAARGRGEKGFWIVLYVPTRLRQHIPFQQPHLVDRGLRVSKLYLQTVHGGIHAVSDKRLHCSYRFAIPEWDVVSAPGGLNR